MNLADSSKTAKIIYCPGFCVLPDDGCNGIVYGKKPHNDNGARGAIHMPREKQRVEDDMTTPRQ